ncbi:adhesion G protein-coupled receptor E5-like [Anguilla anguilla]|uniref:adhesion G protein-coupled receptor E5-like n=1 Tax=Anguilla anguilla TaxID=7936 RepID=UPI0015B070B1|nr:adhesion G protein-coupled receptor E5-like [Anguilla anguilla]
MGLGLYLLILGLLLLQPVKTASSECGVGWETNGDKCIDVDECAYPVCGNRARCFNTNGSYYCQCNPGFHVNSESRTFTGIDGVCRDINECLETPNICGPKASCQNTAGSYNCTCSEGYISSNGQRVFHNATGVTCAELKSDLYKTSGSPDQDAFQLQVITWVGLSVSLVCLLLCIVTFPFCRSIQGTLNFIHIHLCICLFIADLVFLAGISRTEDKVGCGIVAGVLHYFFLAAFCWTLLEGVQLYCMVVLVFNTTLRPIVTITIGYVVPAVIVTASAQGYGTDRHCWLNLENGFIWRFFGPVCIIIIINGMFFVVTVWKLAQKFYCLNSDMCTLRKIKTFTVTAIAQLCVLGTMWISGCFQFEGNTLVASYLFAIFNCLQGALVLIMRCLLYKQVREKHTRFLPCIRKDLSANESGSEPAQAFRTLESD